MKRVVCPQKGRGKKSGDSCDSLGTKSPKIISKGGRIKGKEGLKKGRTHLEKKEQDRGGGNHFCRAGTKKLQVRGTSGFVWPMT